MQLTTHPMWRIQRTNIIHNLRLHIITIVTCQLTTYSRREGLALVIVMVRVDHQRTDDTIAFHTCIRVESQTQVQRDAQACLLWVSLTATRQVVHPLTTGAVVVGIIIATVGVVVDAIWDTRILQPIAGCFQITWHTAGFCPCLILQQLHTIHLRFAQRDVLRRWSILHLVGLRITCHIAHTAAELHRVCSHYHITLTCIAQKHIVITLVRIKCESTQIYPSTTTHLLVYFKLCFLSAVYNGIFRSRSAVGQTLVRHIHRILACWQRMRRIAQLSNLFVAYGRNHISTFLKWVFSFQQHLVVIFSPTSAFAFYPLPHRLSGVPDDARVMGCSFA